MVCWDNTLKISCRYRNPCCLTMSYCNLFFPQASHVFQAVSPKSRRWPNKLLSWTNFNHNGNVNKFSVTETEFCNPEHGSQMILSQNEEMYVAPMTFWRFCWFCPFFWLCWFCCLCWFCWLSQHPPQYHNLWWFIFDILKHQSACFLLLKI